MPFDKLMRVPWHWPTWLLDHENVFGMMMLAPVLTPHGLLTLRQAGEALALEPERRARLEKAFIRGSGHGLLCLGADEVGTALPPVLSYWRELGARYVAALCALPGVAEDAAKPHVSIPEKNELDQIAAAVPPMIGAEYLTADVLADLWRGMDAAFQTELAEAKLSVQQFLKRRHPAWNLVGRVHFNLAENRKDEEGLNLTAASHVIHFDRWWNPAVENQATDRAFRIGQNKNVLVHKFICRGTVEEKIDQMIESKKQLAGDFLSAGADTLLTEMKDAELLRLVALDLNAAMQEG
jgi:Helicase conserved C-terminal domain